MRKCHKFLCEVTDEMQEFRQVSDCLVGNVGGRVLPPGSEAPNCVGEPDLDGPAKRARFGLTVSRPDPAAALNSGDPTQTLGSAQVSPGSVTLTMKNPGNNRIR